MLVDDVIIKVKAGDGGSGAVGFNKVPLMLGPTGGDGGKGGDVIFEGISDIGALSQFRYKKSIKAENGQSGGKQQKDGENGKPAIVLVPAGTVIHNLTTGFDDEIVALGERVLVAKGGMGGKGNFRFRSPKDPSPRRFQKGVPGIEMEIRLELKLIADVGLVGLPNVGKSTLLNELTNARSKVANYEFTTLEPSLGVFGHLIIADIPGLIEGAAGGKGLGIKFLRHIERTRMLLHMVASDSKDPIGDFLVVKKELALYSKELGDRDAIVVLSRADEVDEKHLKKLGTMFRKKKIETIPISILTEDGLTELKKLLTTPQITKLALFPTPPQPSPKRGGRVS
ncbi:MAG: GTPase ObgE [Candidatus Vogelbacteria bacterium CG10_big_fil_rev_8_21_14_0_10_45_14]|uniref:GTPase Obg n=1 Tax=Candidatus Vogelbacteria bacterium CG10_big_fil_rev_8_21_14_0_10_45_14 TaxID=1975042 RepID=A0A2H0RJV4_9BACT|nr:MAG: GTPase ObgE [Candidatus Vogelbacteria bacterium CG10_big_fil_rev_8_21_14_0_10_45_14]